MSFRKRNVSLAGGGGGQRIGGAQVVSPPGTGAAPVPVVTKLHMSGVRPSAVDGRPTTSTGTATLDGLLAGHAGLALGTSLMIEESGTTDYAGALLKFFVAEGLMQGHHVHVVGLPEQWGRELPGVAGNTTERKEQKPVVESADRMKIAWRYERLGQFGADSAARERQSGISASSDTATSTPDTVFCHTFDLTKRLVHPTSARLSFVAVDHHPAKSPFDAVIAKLHSAIASTKPDVVHRIVVPSLLSPALYPLHACQAQHVLKFQHSLRALLTTHASCLVVMQTLPLSLQPRSSGLTRWLELLHDGTIELAPFPHSSDAEFQAARDPATKEEPPQGMLIVHRIPVYHDLAIGIPLADHDWTFTLSRRKFTVKPFNLPPIDGDTDAQQAASTTGSSKTKKEDTEF